jgi:hypothetical protein
MILRRLFAVLLALALGGALPPLLAGPNVITMLVRAPATSFTGDLNHETWETAAGGGPNSNGCDTACSITAGTPNPNFTGTGLITGAEDLYMDGRAATQTITLPAFADRDEIHVAFPLYMITYAGADREIMRFFLNGSQSTSYEIRLDADGDITLGHGATNITVTDNVPTGAPVAVYVTITRDTDGGGASGFGSIEFAGSAQSFAKTGTGTKFDSSAVAAGTGQIDQVVPNAQFSTSGAEYVIGTIIVSSTAIPSNPWGL